MHKDERRKREIKPKNNEGVVFCVFRRRTIHHVNEIIGITPREFHGGGYMRKIFFFFSFGITIRRHCISHAIANSIIIARRHFARN